MLLREPSFWIRIYSKAARKINSSVNTDFTSHQNDSKMIPPDIFLFKTHSDDYRYDSKYWTRTQSIPVIINPIRNCCNLLTIGRNPKAKIFFFSIKKRSNQEMVIATNIPIIYAYGFKLCLTVSIKCVSVLFIHCCTLAFH